LHEQAKIQKDGLRKVKEKLQHTAAKKEANFQSMYNKLMEGHKLAEEMQTMLDLQDSAERRKRKQEHEMWNENVYGAISQNITNRVNSLDYKKINERKRAEYQQFLDATNKKGAIFRDIIIESEYDPMESNRKDIKLKMKKLTDPTKRCLDRAADENALIDPLAAKKAAIKGGGRYTLDVLQWGSLKIGATPHGHFAKMLSEDAAQADPAEAARKAKLTQSSVFMEHYDVPRGNEVIDREFPKGKRVNIPLPEF